MDFGTPTRLTSFQNPIFVGMFIVLCSVFTLRHKKKIATGLHDIERCQFKIQLQYT